MKIRSLAVVAALSLVGLSLTSCSSVDDDAAAVDGESLSNKDFDELLEDLGPLKEADWMAPSGAVSGGFARSVLSLWIVGTTLEDALAEVDEAVTDADTQQATEQVTGDPDMANASQETTDWLVHYLSLQNAANRVGATDAEKGQAILDHVNGADISVSSEYGQWDDASLGVIPLDSDG